MVLRLVMVLAVALLQLTPPQIQRGAYAVAFDERFSIPLDPVALEEDSLRFSVFGIDEDERNISTGVAELKLSDLDLTVRPFNAWLYLQDTNKVRWGDAPRALGFWGFSPIPSSHLVGDGTLCPAGSRHSGGDPALPQLPAHSRAADGGGGQSQEPHLEQWQGDCR